MNKQMTSTELLDITGVPLVMLGGEWTHHRHVSHGLVTEYTWRDDEPVMILFKDGIATRQGAYLVELKDAYHYASSDGMPSPTLFEHSIDAAVALGYDRNDKSAVRKIMDAILDGLPDLLVMPPAPQEMIEAQEAGRSKAEIRLKVDGETVFEGLV